MSKKILVCDDDEGILDIIKIILENKNYQVETVSSGKAIEKKILKYMPDLILLDLWIPGIDGKEITKVLKRDKKLKKIPIVIISALNETGKISQEIGADDFLSKPFDLTDLTNVVEKYVR
jgi:two-component system phosphate regulon response regulator PhoB